MNSPTYQGVNRVIGKLGKLSGSPEYPLAVGPLSLRGEHMSEVRAVVELKRPVAVWRVVIRRVLLDLGLLNIALALSHFALGVLPFPESVPNVMAAYAVVNLLGGIVLVARRIYRVSARYVGLLDFPNVALASTVIAAALLVLEFALPTLPKPIHPLGYAALFSMFFISLWGGFRLAIKFKQFPSLFRRVSGQEATTRTVLIVGAGDAGDLVCRELARHHNKLGRVVGFVDDDPAKQGQTINGFPVLGRVIDIPELVKRIGVDELMIAIPSASGEQMRRIFEISQTTRATLRTLPSFEDMLDGKSQMLPHMREFRVEDLLRRDAVKEEVEVAQGYLNGETVMITGGGGSIGSELARQVVRHQPAAVILLGKGENSIFEIDQELRQAGYAGSRAIVCDVKDRASLARVFDRYKPSIVYHAAAHKHVPLMEDVPIEAIRNNIFGTLAVAEESVRHGVKKMILVSTDKAVNPSNVMGASKRVAEMIIGSMATRYETGFSAVRFGNVLGSRGSLVPILKKQIAKGGPITITHPEMTRFFMTIPEASRLILHAGAIGDRGEIFILDMGQPIKIVELAKEMVHMHGLVPGDDIEIKFTGIRPGEKLHEELAYAAEELKTCAHPKIRVVANEKPVSWEWLIARLDQLQTLCDQGDAETARASLMDLAWAKNSPPVHLSPSDPVG